VRFVGASARGQPCEASLSRCEGARSRSAMGTRLVRRRPAHRQERSRGLNVLLQLRGSLRSSVSTDSFVWACISHESVVACARVLRSTICKMYIRRDRFVVSMVLWGLLQACGGDEHGGSGENDAGLDGGSEDVETDASGGGTGDGGSTDGDGGDIDADAGSQDPCSAVECAYGEECVEGSCRDICANGQVYCDGSCIDPLTNQQFCGALPGCDQGLGSLLPAAGDAGGGADPDGGAVSRPASAGENCGAGGVCVNGTCQEPMTPGSDAVVERDGFAVRCTQWEETVCVKPWIRIGESRIVAQGSPEGCIDDTESLRPIWWYDDGEAEARTFCYVATGNANASYSTEDGVAGEHGGWMYGQYVGLGDEPQCDEYDFRKYAEVDSPGDLDNIVWSFDLMSEVRGGEFLRIECEW
jgi:hypothetical protein